MQGNLTSALLSLLVPKVPKLKPIVSMLMIISLSLSCKFFTPDSMDLTQISEGLSNLPAFDPEAPLPSPGAAALRMLAVDEPGVAALVDDVEAAERAALEAARADLEQQLDTQGATPLSDLGPGSRLALSSVDLRAAGAALLPVVDVPPFSPFAADGDKGAGDATGQIVSIFSDMFISQLPAVPNQTRSETGTVGDATTAMREEFGRDDDGSTTFGLGLQTEGTKNGVSVKTDNSAKVKGQRCPDVNGQVHFTITARSGSESGGSGQTQDLTAVVQATVNDDAEITSSQIDVVQGTREVKNGRQKYVESGMTVKFKGADFGAWDASGITMIHASQDVTPNDDLSEPGLKNAVAMGVDSLAWARHWWQSGACTTIKAVSPGSVRPSSSTQIPVKVVSRFGGSDIPSKLLAALSGEKSIDPTSLPRTPGTLTYTAPSEAGANATVHLEARSKRGIAKLDLAFTVGGYRVDTVWQEIHIYGTICSRPGDPFGLEWDTQVGLAGTLDFVPSSEHGGSWSLTGSYGGGVVTNSGEGTYTIESPTEGAAASIVLQGGQITQTTEGYGSVTQGMPKQAIPLEPYACDSQ